MRVSDVMRLGLSPGAFTAVSGFVLTGVITLLSSPEEASQLAVIGSLSIAIGVIVATWSITIDGEHWWTVLGENSRPRPGVAFHMLVRLHQGEMARRRYLLQHSNGEGSIASLYLSASEILTFSITDFNGESYSVETKPGSNGLSIGEFCYLYAEVAKRKKTTRLVIGINKEVVAERILPFVIDMREGNWGASGSIGASMAGQDNCKMDLGGLIMRDKTLSKREKLDTLRFFAERGGL